MNENRARARGTDRRAEGHTPPGPARLRWASRARSTRGRRRDRRRLRPPNRSPRPGRRTQSPARARAMSPWVRHVATPKLASSSRYADSIRSAVAARRSSGAASQVPGGHRPRGGAHPVSPPQSRSACRRTREASDAGRTGTAESFRPDAVDVGRHGLPSIRRYPMQRGSGEEVPTAGKRRERLHGEVGPASLQEGAV